MSDELRAAKGTSGVFAAGGPSGRAVLRLFCLLALVFPPLSAHAAVPAAPTELRATAVYSNKIELAWNDNSNDEMYFYVEYLLDGKWTSLRTLSANNTTFTHSNLPQNTVYTYRIRAYNASGSSYSNELPVQTGILNAPSGLAASTISYTQITLVWTDNSNDESGFQIERLAAPGGAVVQTYSAAANAASYQVSGLTQGTEYSFRMRAYNYASPAYNYSEYAYLDSVMTKELIAPSNLSVTPLSSSQIKLTWTDNSSDETNFCVEYKEVSSTGNYTVAWAGGKDVTEVELANLKQETAYTMRVKAYNAGIYSLPSNEVSAATGKLNAPTDLTASASYANLTLAWKDNSNDENGFQIERLASPGGAVVQSYFAAANAASYQVLGLTQDTEYFFRVRAKSGNSNLSDPTNEVTVRTLKLIAPSDLAAEPVASSQIRLAWTPAADGATHYYIYYKESSSPGGYSSAPVPAPSTEYTMLNLKQETEYMFYLKSYNGGYYSPPTDTVTATTLTLAAPSDLSASSVSYRELTITWTDNTPDEGGFKIERKTGAGGTYNLIATLGANTTSYRNAGLTPGTEYFYRVQAYRNTNLSEYSGDLRVVTSTFDAPSDLAAEPVSSTKIRLTWQDNTIDETQFSIEYKRTSDPSYSTASAGANSTSYTVTNLKPDTEYTFRVKAYGPVYGGYSDYSDPVTAATLTFDAPSGLAATALSSTKIQLAWTDNTADETYFSIEYKVAGGGYFSPLTSVPANTTTYTHTNLAANTTYVYRVYAWNSAAGASPYSNEASAVAQDAPPTGLQAAALSSKRIRLTWADVSGETQYSLEYRTGDAVNYSVLATLPADTTSYSHTGLAAATAYSYRIRAYNGVSYTPYSNEAAATTPECVEEGTYQP